MLAIFLHFNHLCCISHRYVRYDCRFWQLMTAPDESETAWLNLFQVLDQFTTGDEMVEMSAYGILLTALALWLCFLLRSDL